MKTILKGSGALIIAVAVYLLAWPVEIDPQGWQPLPSPGFTGDFASNSALAAVERLGVDIGIGPEDVELDGHGNAYVGYIDGRLVRFNLQTGAHTELVNTGGRPLGLEFAPDGTLVIADAIAGLLAWNGAELKTLATEAGGVTFGFADDLDVADDGTIYLSDASWKYGVDNVRADFFEHGAYGRLIRYEPTTGVADVLLDNLYFANGIAVGPDEAFVLVNETSEYRVRKYWLTGDKAGSSDIIVPNLPGFPDGISSNGNGIYWVAIYGPRSPDLDRLAPRPWMTKLVWRLPEAVQPSPVMHGMLVGIDADGNILHNLQDPSPDSYAPITSVEQHGDWLYLGSLSAPAFGRIKVPQ